MSTKLKIKLKSFGEVIYKEGIYLAGEPTIKPGTFLFQDGEDFTVMWDNPEGDMPVVVAVERSDIGEGVEGDLVAEERIRTYRAEVGQEYNARFNAGLNVFVGDPLMYGTDGQLKKSSVIGDIAQFIAIEDSDGTTTAGQLLAVRIVAQQVRV